MRLIEDITQRPPRTAGAPSLISNHGIEFIYDWIRAGYSAAEIARGVWEWYGFANALSCTNAIRNRMHADRVLRHVEIGATALKRTAREETPR